MSQKTISPAPTAPLVPQTVVRIAPMMDWTDRHQRYFLRLITRRAMVYSEMITADAILHGDRDYLLGFDAEEHPVAVQLGGSDPGKLAQAARIAQDYGYDEINLNVGCPSDRVQSGRFGACLMLEPVLVGECLSAMRAAVDLPVTVKCRIGVDDQDGEETLDRFVAAVSGAGVRTLIVHARKAWLKGLSPKENRDIPPLDYNRVYRLKQDWPDLNIVINGGIENLDQANGHLDRLDGVMIGRAAYQNPYMLSGVDERFYGEDIAPRDRFGVIDDLLPYISDQLAFGEPLHAMTRHILQLFQGQPGARIWRRTLSEKACRPGAGRDVVQEARDLVHQAQIQSSSVFQDLAAAPPPEAIISQSAVEHAAKITS